MEENGNNKLWKERREKPKRRNEFSTSALRVNFLLFLIFCARNDCRHHHVIDVDGVDEGGSGSNGPIANFLVCNGKPLLYAIIMCVQCVYASTRFGLNEEQNSHRPHNWREEAKKCVTNFWNSQFVVSEKKCVAFGHNRREYQTPHRTPLILLT